MRLWTGSGTGMESNWISQKVNLTQIYSMDMDTCITVTVKGYILRCIHSKLPKWSGVGGMEQLVGEHHIIFLLNFNQDQIYHAIVSNVGHKLGDETEEETGDQFISVQKAEGWVEGR